MISIREKVFESNSSSCHCLTLLQKDELLNFAKNCWTKCIYLPDTGDYQTGNEYRIMVREDAFKQYNEDHIKQNIGYKERGYESLCVKEYEDSEAGFEEWEEDLEEGNLDDDLGKYLTFNDLMAYAVIEGPMKFDVEWWNND